MTDHKAVVAILAMSEYRVFHFSLPEKGCNHIVGPWNTHVINGKYIQVSLFAQSMTGDRQFDKRDYSNGSSS